MFSGKSKKQDLLFMARALELAKRAEGKTSPNPLVGAVIVKKGRIIGEGYHHRAGEPHAEIEALKKAGKKAQGATLYCNLEPCCHHGRTPPCVDAILTSGISRVVVSHADPNPLVQGKSLRRLRQAGIKVTTGVLEREARELNRFFIMWVTQKRPYIIVKMAMTLDGKIASGRHGSTGSPCSVHLRNKEPNTLSLSKGGRSGRQKWITGPVARHRVHEIRSQVDAILVGVNTVIADNPRLNVRGIEGAKQPVRIILGRASRISRNAKIFTSRGGPVWFVTSYRTPPPNPLPQGEGEILLFPLPRGERGRERVRCVPLQKLFKYLAKREITSVLIEGGGEVFRSFLEAGLCDELILHVAPKIFPEGGLDISPVLQRFGPKLFLKLNRAAFLGHDLEMRFVRYRAKI